MATFFQEATLLRNLFKNLKLKLIYLYSIAEQGFIKISKYRKRYMCLMKNKQIQIIYTNLNSKLPLKCCLFSRKTRKTEGCTYIFLNNLYDTVDQHPHSHIMLKTH